MNKAVYYILIPVTFILIGWFANTAYHLPKNSNPIAQIKPTPLNKYTIENLSKTVFKPSMIEMGKILKDDPKFTSYEFTFAFSPDLSGNLKKTSGLINIPKGKGPFPVIVMFRGYVDQKQYTIGDGTRRVAEIFTKNGYITLAPDFLGYGDSDAEASDIFEARFQTYITAVSVLRSVGLIDSWDKKNVFIWAHSNGGQIALTALEITGTDYPTVLWAPNSAKFPYSIIYYLDEAGDQGKLIITKLAEFMADYDVTKFAFGNYLTQIKAAIEINQGTADTSVPVLWSDSLVKKLKALKIDTEYIKYPASDHNLQPLWNKAAENSLQFFKTRLTNGRSNQSKYF